MGQLPSTFECLRVKEKLCSPNTYCQLLFSYKSKFEMNFVQLQLHIITLFAIPDTNLQKPMLHAHLTKLFS